MILGNPLSTFFYLRRFAFVRSRLHGTLLLDVGCGIYKVRQDAIGVDLKAWKRPNVNASAFDLPFAAGTFDAVTALEVVEHITPDNQGLLVYELWRVLKPGGLLVMSTPNLSKWWDVPYRLIWWVWERTIQREYYRDHIGMVPQAQTEALLRWWFRLVESKRVGVLDRVFVCVKP